jgi:Effector-associated domain 11
MQNSVEEIEKLLLKNKIEKAIDQLLESTKSLGSEDLYNSVALQSSTFHNCEDKYSEQRISQADYDTQRAKIVKALQSILKEYKVH